VLRSPGHLDGPPRLQRLEARAGGQAEQVNSRGVTFSPISPAHNLAPA